MVDLRFILHFFRAIGSQTGEDLFLAQKIEVGVTAGTRIDDGGKVA